MFRAGDTVFHRPSGETWTLSCDEVMDRVLPCGWPETIAVASDCELREAAPDSLRLGQLVDTSGASGYRGSVAREQLERALAQSVDAVRGSAENPS